MLCNLRISHYALWYYKIVPLNKSHFYIVQYFFLWFYLGMKVVKLFISLYLTSNIYKNVRIMVKLCKVYQKIPYTNLFKNNSSLYFTKIRSNAYKISLTWWMYHNFQYMHRISGIWLFYIQPLYTSIWNLITPHLSKSITSVALYILIYQHHCLKYVKNMHHWSSIIGISFPDKFNNNKPVCVWCLYLKIKWLSDYIFYSPRLYYYMFEYMYIKSKIRRTDQK